MNDYDPDKDITIDGVGMGRSHRWDGKEYPPPRNGYVNLARAISLFGTALVAEGFDHELFRELSRKNYVVDPLFSTITERNRFRLAKAHKYCRFVANNFAWCCANGKIPTGYARIGGGKIEIMPPDWWELDDSLIYFRSMGIDPSDPFGGGFATTHWIWVEEQPLTYACQLIENSRKGLGPPLPPGHEQYIEYGYDEAGDPILEINEDGMIQQAMRYRVPSLRPHGPGRPDKTGRVLEP